jgi:5S rRNA maturation endonuclease (ribonuclease M5)
MNRGYTHGVDQLIEGTPLDQVLAHFGKPLPQKSTGEYRMPCVFSESCKDSTYGSLTVNLSDPAKVIFCHVCGVRGNLLTLIHGLQHHKAPTDGKLRGNEFRESVAILQRIRGVLETQPQTAVPSPASPPTAPEAAPALVNIPLKDQEKTKGLVTLWEELVVEVESMPPAAASYFRKRPWLTPDVCRKWKMGYLPRDASSLFRGTIIYGHQSEAGDILTYSSRDAAFESKWEEWIRDGRPETKKPMKHRYVKGYHRGLELYGQSKERLPDPQIRASLDALGLVVVEGMNDAIRLDSLGIAAVALCSNKATEEQVAKIERFARAVARSRIVLMPDNDEEGEAGFKDLLWALSEKGFDVRLAWSRRSHRGRFVGRQPEGIAAEEWDVIQAR